MAGAYAKEVHDRLEQLFGYDRNKQYKWLRSVVGKSHVSELTPAEFRKVINLLRQRGTISERIWKQVESKI